MGIGNWGELTPTERRLAEAVADGEWFDAEGDAVRGELVRGLLLDRFPWPLNKSADPRGVRVRNATLAGGLDLADIDSNLPLHLIDCHADDTIRLTGARLASLDLSGLTGTNIVAHECHIERSVMLIGAHLECASPHGVVSFGAAHVGASMDLSGSTLVNTHPEGPAFHGNYLLVGAGLFLNRGFRAESTGPMGAIRLSGAELGQLNLLGAWISNPNGPALVGDYLSTRSNVMFRQGFHAEGRHANGTIRLVGARIGGRLMCDGGNAFAAQEGDLAVNLSQVHVGGDLLLPATFTPGLLRLDGLAYDGMVRGASLPEWLRLLAERTTHYSSQPYLQLAAAHRVAGHERDVRRIHLARQRDLGRRGDLGFWSRLWHRITGWTVGYGYRPAVAVLWWAGTLVLSVLLIVAVAGPAGLTARGGAPCSGAEQVGLALNVATPLIKPDAQQRCQLDTAAGLGQAVVAMLWVLQALAWAFVTLFIAGFTGLVRKSG